MALLPHQALMIMLLIWYSKGVLATSDHESQNVHHQTFVSKEVETEIKCGSCPCVNPCEQQQLLPPPPPPPPETQNCNPSNQYVPPPPPRFVYVTSLPGDEFVPPPPPRFVYVTGLPGDVYQYQTDAYAYYSGAAQNCVKLGLLLMALNVVMV